MDLACAELVHGPAPGPLREQLQDTVTGTSGDWVDLPE